MIAPHTTHHCDLYVLIGWPSLHIRRQTHWLQVICKSLLGKALPYLSSLVTIAAPTRSMHSSRYISLVIPKANSSFGCLSFQFSAANDWIELEKSLKLETHISLTNFKHQLSEQLTDHCTCTQPIQLPHPHVVVFFAPSSLWPIYCLYLPNLTSFAHTVYIFFSIVLLTMFAYSMFNSVLLFLSHCFALSWPCRSCKGELVLNWPTWINKGEIKKFLSCITHLICIYCILYYSTVS